MTNLENNSESHENIYAKSVELASLVGTYLWKTNYKKLLANDFKNRIALKKGLQRLKKNSSKELSEAIDDTKSTADKGKIEEVKILIDDVEHDMTESQILSKLEEISKKMYDTLNDFHNLIQVDDTQESETGNTGLDEMDLEALLDEDFTYDIMDRIRELYAQDQVRSYYESELVSRKDNFTLLKHGYTHLHEVNKLDDIIEQAKDKILDIRIKAFKNRRQVNPQEMVLINKIKEHINLKIEEKETLLEFKEIKTVYRLEELRKYRKQFETSGYIKTPSLEKLIDKTIDYVLLGKNILLTGPTGTGKTVLAVEAVKAIAKKMNMQVAKVSGKRLGEELQDKDNLKELNDFISSIQEGGEENLENNIWTNDFEINDLKIGMRVKCNDVHIKSEKESISQIGYISSIENGDIHIYLGNNDYIVYRDIKKTKISIFSEDLKKSELLVGKYNEDDFIEVLSGHAGITPSEFISKVRLQTDGKGGTETVSELGKVLKAFVNGSIPIIDEVDLIPNDVLMRIKHLFTLKVGQSYAPQEDGGQRHTLISTSVMATANIKSDKHPDREDLDPAIIRLFKGVEVGYLPSHEIYDIAITSIIQKEGFIYGTGVEALTDTQQGILYLLIAALKDIESNYLGIDNGEKILNKSKQFLRKAVLELGNFIGLFVGFKESGKEFNDFIKEQILEFVSNHAYPKNDRLIIMRIFSSKGLIIKSDINLLKEMMSDIGEGELDDAITSPTFNFKGDTVNFVDPYQLANMDPYKKRNLDELELKYKPAEIGTYLKELDSFLMEENVDNSDELENYIQDIFDEIDKDITFDLETSRQQQQLLALLYDVELTEWILKLEDEYPDFDENIKKLKMIDMTEGKKLFGDLTKKEDSSPMGIYMQGLLDMIIDNNIEGQSEEIDKLEMFIKNFQDNKHEDPDFDLTEPEQQMELLGLLYELELVEWISKLDYEHPNFSETIAKLMILDKYDKKNGKKILVDI